VNLGTHSLSCSWSKEKIETKHNKTQQNTTKHNKTQQNTTKHNKLTTLKKKMTKSNCRSRYSLFLPSSTLHERSFRQASSLQRRILRPWMAPPTSAELI
jgi:hypothetical protein